MNMDLFPIWHLRPIDGPPESWRFSTNYKLSIEDTVLRSRLQAETDPPMRLTEEDNLEARVHALLSEVTILAGGPSTITEGDLSLHVTKRLRRLMRKPGQTGRENELICVGDDLDAAGSAVREFSVVVDLAHLGAPSRRAVHELDMLSLRTCHTLFGDRLQTLQDYPPEAVPPLRRVSVFVAYRRSHEAEARRVHRVLEQMGGGSFFDPYLDLHDMRLGDWKQQLMARIDAADVFLPIVSADYADVGTVGLEELERARSSAEARGISDFFAPIFIGTPGTDAGSEIRSFDGFEVDDRSRLLSDSGALEAWLGRVLLAGLSR